MIPVTTFRGRRVALFGLGGSGLASARALLAGGAAIVCDDDGPGREAAGAQGLPVADLRTADWSPFDALLLSPGVPLTHPAPHWSVRKAEARGIEVIIAGAGGAAHLPGMAAAMTPLPVLGVPVESHALKGMDSLLSIVQMTAGVPVGTLAIGRAGAVNAALLAAAILALSDPGLAARLAAWRAAQTESVPTEPR
jgi:phosphoribosylaminoimidazole carboxylase PurE protein